MSGLSIADIKKLLQALPAELEELGREVRKGFSSAGKAVARKLTNCISAVYEHDDYVAHVNPYVNCDPVSFIWVSGPDGVGKKELLQRIEVECPSRKGLFESHCETKSPDQIEAELFGHRRHDVGNRTGDRSGKLSKAGDGILCVYEIDTAPPAIQKRLLECKEPGSLRRLGDDLPEPDPDPLVIFVTRERPALLVQQERVLRGLLTRALEDIRISPLTECPEDVVPLMEHFLRAKGTEFHKREFSLERNLDLEVLWLLVNFHWPENVRALREILSRLISHYLASDHDHVITLAEVVEALTTKYGNEILRQLTPSFRRGPLPPDQRYSGRKRIPPDEIMVFRGLFDMGWHLDDLGRLLGRTPSQVSRLIDQIDPEELQRGRPRGVI